MMNKKINIKTMVIATLTSFSLLLTGCQKNETTKKNQENSSSQSVIEYQNMVEQPSNETVTESPNQSSIEEQPSTSYVQEEIQPSTDLDEELYQEPIQEDAYEDYVSEEYYYEEQQENQPTEEPYTEESSYDSNYSETNQSNEEFTFFEDAKSEISSYVDSEDFENLKDKGKYYITTGIDFIFYDEPINGVYYQDLKEEAKTAIINDVHIIDEAIMAYFPTYKETISSKYQVATDFLSEKYLDVMDAIKNYLGDENYEAIGEIKDQIIGDISDAKDKAFGYIKDKYENWRNQS